MNGAAALAVAVIFAGSVLAREAAAGCRYSRDFEGEERSWVGWSPMQVGYRDDDGVDKDSPMILSAQISLTVPVGFVCGTPQHGETLWQWVPSMNLQLTQIAEHSAAVLPPSFNPRILRFGFRYRWWQDKRRALSPDGREQAWGVLATAWTHHSDGQYEPTYLDAMAQVTDDLGQAVRANRDSGDFATNYVGARGWYRRSRLDANGNHPKHSLFLSAEYQFHHGALFPGALSPKLEPIWGRHHLLFAGHYRTGYQHDYRGDVQPADDLGGSYWLVAVDAWLPIDAGDHPVVSSDFARAAVEAAWFIPKYLGPGGLFVRGALGRNPLNIRFVENRNEIIVGIMLDTSQSIERLPPAE